MKLLRLPSNTLARVNGRNYYLSNQDPRISLIEGKDDDQEVERILSFKFLEDIDSNFSAINNEIFFCGSRFPSTIIAKYLKKEIKENTFRSLVNGWSNGARGCQNLEQLEKLQNFLDNNSPVVANGLVYLSSNKNLPDYGEIPVTISYGNIGVLKGKNFEDFIREYYPEASKKFINKLVKKTFINLQDAYFSHIYITAFAPIFGWDKIVHLVTECTVKDKWDLEKFEKVKKFVEEIKYKKNAMSFYNFFKKTKEITFDFIDQVENLQYWSQIEFDKIKSVEDIEYAVKYIKLLEKPNKPTIYDLQNKILKEPFIEDYYLVLPKDTHELAQFGFDCRNCMAEGGYDWKSSIIGVLKRNKSDPEYALHFGNGNFQFRFKRNKEPDEEFKQLVRHRCQSIKTSELFKRG